MERPLKATYTPLYEQVKKDIMQRIIDGEWSPGSFLPSEQALALEYGVSQGTLRKALNGLTREKRLVRYQGKGTAVAVLDEDSSLFPFFLLSDRNGKKVFPISQVHGIVKDTPTILEQTALALDVGRPVIRIERLRVLNNYPVINEWVTLPEARFVGFNFDCTKIPNTLYGYYQMHFGITVARAMEQIDAALPDPVDCKRLGLDRNTPILRVMRTTYDLHNKPVEFRVSHINTTKHIYRADLH